MKLVYTHENIMLVENAKNYLYENGIDAVLKNQFSSGAFGELAATDTWSELWVDNSDFDKSTQLIATLQTLLTGESWICSACGEENEPSFEICWNCQNERR